MPNLLCFGDSNTHGTVPMAVFGENARFGPDIRWPTVAAAELGEEWTLVEEGLPGRTWSFDDPLMGGHMNGHVGLRIALDTHRPLDFVLLMLGTNDVKAKFAATPEEIARQAGRALDYCLTSAIQSDHAGFTPILMCPPAVFETGCLIGQFPGAAAKSLRLADLYREQAEGRGIPFLNAGEFIESSSLDGIHIEAPDHQTLGRAVAEFLAEL